MDETRLAQYWDQLPIGKENAMTYGELCNAWNMTERQARHTLQELSGFDNGDNYILIRSSANRGFYKTDNEAELKAYRKECLNKGRSIFAPVKKINRVLQTMGDMQINIENNMRVVREGKGMKQREVCKQMKKFDRAFDVSLLSKMENGICLPTYYQLAHLADIFGCEPSDLVSDNLY